MTERVVFNKEHKTSGKHFAPALLDWFYKNRRILPFREDPSPTMSGSARSCCSRPGSRRRCPTTSAFLPPCRISPRWPPARRKSCTSCGRGWVITAGCATCKRLQASSARSTAGSCLLITTPCAPCPASGITRREPLPAISFGLPVPAVDGNVLRVFARLYNDPGWLPNRQVKRAFTARVMEHQPPAKARHYNQALMELGALVCLPNGAPCASNARWHALPGPGGGHALALPQKSPPRPGKLHPVTVALVESRPGASAAAARQGPAGRAVAAGAVGGQHPCRRRDRRPPCCPGAGLHRAHFTPLPAAKHIFTHIEWHQSGYSSLCRNSPPPQAASGPERSSWRHVHPARCLQGLQKAAADQIAVIARIDEISAFWIVIFGCNGYNSSLIEMNSGSMNHRSPPEKECMNL